MRTHKSIWIGLLAVLLSGVAFIAHAATSETLSGANCQSTYPPNSSLSSDIYHNAYSISNQSTGWRYLACPVQRVLGTSTAGWQPAVIATDNTNQLWCTAVTYDEFGNQVAASTKTIPAGTGARLINYPTLTTSTWGYVDVSCVMPAGSSVQQILAQEF